MSWQRMRVFKCNLCGKERGAYSSDCLPPGWHGSSKKRGECYCGDCHDSIRGKPWAKPLENILGEVDAEVFAAFKEGYLEVVGG